MSEVIPIEDNQQRGFTDAYDEFTLRLGDLKALGSLFSVSDTADISKKEMNSVGFMLERMGDDLLVRAGELYHLGSANE